MAKKKHYPDAEVAERTIGEMQADKSRLQSLILSELQAFEAKYGLAVTEVYVDPGRVGEGYIDPLEKVFLMVEFA
jgi:hypothetical protein